MLGAGDLVDPFPLLGSGDLVDPLPPFPFPEFGDFVPPLPHDLGLFVLFDPFFPPLLRLLRSRFCVRLAFLLEFLGDFAFGFLEFFFPPFPHLVGSGVAIRVGCGEIDGDWLMLGTVVGRTDTDGNWLTVGADVGDGERDGELLCTFEGIWEGEMIDDGIAESRAILTEGFGDRDGNADGLRGFMDGCELGS